jgi:nitrogen fixation/metabolism regulation signal transduction histidine kinase
LSAYVPFRNYNNDVIAYLNLPYFARQSEYRTEISNFIIAFSNIFLVLILGSIIVGIFISRQLTRPLVIIRDKIRAMDLKEKTEKIVYTKNDEIGVLIREYNRKVDELSESANKLAQSEREFAWREMAKQIAHEIKNPLTPMKLSVQYLERAYDMKDKNWEDTYKKVSKTLIEQIDTLSRIASEFSNFAQMPESKKQTIDLREVIMSSVQLFAAAENVEFILNFRAQEPITVKVDKEQMLRVFNNLIKNSIQAIPKNKEGKINITIDEIEDKYIIKVVDNGIGIPSTMISRMFQPNFTTKSAGMGLGLSMVKNMLLSNNATIFFKTKENEGTEFIIEIPKA